MSKCSYYNAHDGYCSSPYNPCNRSGGSTSSGIEHNKCSLRAEDCALNGGRSRGYCGYYNAHDGCCSSPYNPCNRSGGSTSSGIGHNKCSLRSEDCALNGGRSRGYCGYYNAHDGCCSSPYNPCNRSGGSTSSGIEYNKCSLRSEDCALNGGRSRGYCGYYNAHDGCCSSPYNPCNRSGGSTSSGIEYNKCSLRSENCQFSR